MRERDNGGVVQSSRGVVHSFQFITLRSASFLIFTVAVLSICIFSIEQESFATIISFFIFAGGGFIISRILGRVEAQIYSLILAVSVVAAIILYYIYLSRYGVPYYFGGSDDLSYEKQANLIASSIFYYNSDYIKNITNQPFHNSPGYVYLVSLLVSLGNLLDGFHSMMPRLLNCCFLGLISVSVFSTAKKLKLSQRHAKMAALWTGLFPMMIYTAVHTFRDILVSLLLVLFLKCMLEINQRKSIITTFVPSALAAFIFLVILELRGFYIIPLSAMIVAALASRIWFEKRLSALTLLFGLIALILLWLSMQRVDIDIEIFTRLSRYIGIYENWLVGNSPGLSTVLFSLPPPISYFARFAYALVNPLPLFYSLLEFNLLGLGTFFQFMAVPFVLLGIKATYRQTSLLPLFVAFILLFGGYFLGTFTVRHIASFFPFAVLYGTVGYSLYKSIRYQIWSICIGVLFVAAVTYVLLKYPTLMAS